MAVVRVPVLTLDPVTALLPLQEPDALQVSTLALDQLSDAADPAVM